MTKIACVIPARLHSTRFPKKILAPLHGKPLIQWAWEAACRVSLFDSVTIALDSKETESVVKTFGASYRMTQQTCPSGTSRLCEMVNQHNLEGDIFVNWQADEPFLNETMMKELLQTASADKADVWTLKKEMHNFELATSPHVVKVVTDQEGYALYFSRSLIPYHRDQKTVSYHKHIGLYAYRRQTLKKLSSFPECNLAQLEQLEQLNFLYYGLKIKVHETSFEGFGIDVPEHLEQAHRL